MMELSAATDAVPVNLDNCRTPTYTMQMRSPLLPSCGTIHMDAQCVPTTSQFWTLKYVDPATYQILGNLKIVTTGVLFRLLLRRRLSTLQWIALALLMIGATTSQVLHVMSRSCSVLHVTGILLSPSFPAPSHLHFAILLGASPRAGGEDCLVALIVLTWAGSQHLAVT